MKSLLKQDSDIEVSNRIFKRFYTIQGYAELPSSYLIRMNQFDYKY
jgi:hypothetical protein